MVLGGRGDWGSASEGLGESDGARMRERSDWGKRGTGEVEFKKM